MQLLPPSSLGPPCSWSASARVFPHSSQLFSPRHSAGFLLAERPRTQASSPSRAVVPEGGGSARARECVRAGVRERASSSSVSPGWAAAAAAAAVEVEEEAAAAAAAGGGGGGGSSGEMAETVADTRRLITKPQNLNDAYGPPSNFLEIDVSNPQTVGVGRGRFTTYEIRVKTNLPIFKLKESSVRRRYSDFEWLRSELERESKVVVPPLPGKAFLRQLPFRGDDGIFDDSFIEERKQGLEQFINKVAGHPLAQNERCLHMFLQDEIIDKSYTPSKIRHA
ncbi:sorting nexin-3 [Phascolarctos cinereus]|nr:sorting nexin-3 [Phascolarctos cinereus]